MAGSHEFVGKVVSCVYSSYTYGKDTVKSHGPVAKCKDIDSFGFSAFCRRIEEQEFTEGDVKHSFVFFSAIFHFLLVVVSTYKWRDCVVSVNYSRDNHHSSVTICSVFPALY